MKMQSGATLRALIRQGANLELDARQVDIGLACDLAEIGGTSQFVFLNADHYPPASLERLASIGHSRITFRFNASQDVGGKKA
jgi:hypothetical protein